MFLTNRAFRWAGPLAVTVLAAVLRLWNLGSPHSLVFDETFYVKDAWTLFNHGYESTWPDQADTLFAAGQTHIFLTAPSFVVHPPLGKWLIALGMAAFGPDSSWGWRIMTALIGVLAVVLLMLIAKRLLGSTLLAVIAGFLFAIDGNAIVMSRVALLDNYVMFFALLGFGAVLLDRDWHAGRLAARVARERDAGRDPGWGPALWWRPWLLAAGLAFGLTSSVKWSGFYFLAAFGVYLVVVDALARRRAGIPFWWSAALLKQAPATFLLTVPIAVATYLVAWTGWFVTAGGYYRDWASSPGAAWTGALAWVPGTVQSFWHYQVAAYTYHVGLSTPHPYQANPLTWLFMIRPTSMYYRGSSLGENGCGTGTCSEAITGIANPLIWWAATAAIFYLVYRLARYREWRVGLILMGLVAGYLPWLMYLNRTVFQFYTITFEPYLLLGLTFVIGVILRLAPTDAAPAAASGDVTDAAVTDASLTDAAPPGAAAPDAAPAQARWLVLAFLIAATVVSAFFYPLWTGTQTSLQYWQLHIWLPGWR
ncbi:phospholipid carrier-dependent glycosyltransferase [Cryobacterium sp. TmT2-59]|uniref:dolichyl-phosphate-mannose--protein mannosyltransferase n=1 Tax=Cryobacterium sp. TmT2-59 TaxID=1259264 RepID=UPI00106BD2C5|nr:phospholipid carrier-dependent glycosyltransferase [Cryobacterium sp. TmT2-59]TFC80897.1 phospholipid carrier-dependent glycosyltransferase [Cryobacterium sp. TmT2-59]